MAQELVYTSAPRGLRLGSSGFCTVACTRGMGANYVEVLESLSGYAAVYPPHDPQAGMNPVAFSHYRYTIGGRGVSILSRVAAAGVDYTQRPNKFAHHLVLGPGERPDGGPAWLMQSPDLMLESWEGGPRFLDRPRTIPPGDSAAAPCRAWQEHAGDAGWAGVLAQSFLEDDDQPAFIVFEPGAPMLDLIAEALGLLPADERWRVTFNTYFTQLPMGSACAWRCCLPDADALRQARRTPGTLVLDLTAGGPQPPEAEARMAEGSPLIQSARTGTPPPPPLDAVGKPGPAAADEDEELIPPPPGARRRPRGPRRGLRSAPPVRVHVESAPAGLKAAVVILVLVLLASVAANVRLWTRAGRGAALGSGDESGSDTGERVAQPDQDGEALRAALEAAKKKLKQAEQAQAAVAAERDALRRELDRANPYSGNSATTAAAPVTVRSTAVAADRGRMLTDLETKNRWQIEIGPQAGAVYVERIGWWRGDEPAELTQTRSGNALRLSGPDMMGQAQDYVIVRFVDGRLCFDRAERVTRALLEKARIERVAWIALRSANARRLLFVAPRPRGRIALRRKRVSIAVYEGQTESLDPVLKDLRRVWPDAGRDKLQGRARFDAGNRLSATVTYTGKPTPDIFPTTLRFRADDVRAGAERTVAEFDLVPPE